jgi:hypothetical protein
VTSNTNVTDPRQWPVPENDVAVAFISVPFTGCALVSAALKDPKQFNFVAFGLGFVRMSGSK